MLKARFLTLFIIAQFVLASFTQAETFPKWAYDAGPDITTSMGRELVDLNSSIPSFPEVSYKVTGAQKFRPAFGPIPWRMLQKPNSVKILFIGQDGTHIAEAAGRPATAGFGGRAQDLAKYFGVSSSAAFINTYAFTIKGQYGSFDAPILHLNAEGKASVSFSSFVDNQLWLISQDQGSPIVQWRNKLIEWIIRNNRDSLKMIVLFGGAARDAAATFIESRGGKVGTRTNASSLSSIRVPEMFLTSAGGNNEEPVPYSREGQDLYAKLAGHPFKYSNPQDIEKAHGQLTAALAKDPEATLENFVLAKGGLNGSGIIHPAQLGGFDLERQMEINGVKTISLKGLKISEDTTIDHDLLVVQLPHPSALSKMEKDEASKKVGAALTLFKPYVEKGWKIQPDDGLQNTFAAGQPYKYGRSNMGPEFYDFGAPASRMVDVSSASRLSSNVIVFGTRDQVNFDQKLIQDMTQAQPSKLPSASEMWISRSRSAETRTLFDPGPPEKYARLMKESVPDSLIASHPVNESFGHYRGTFNKPRAIILADPDGYDDLITARALTGTRGQYLHGLMEDLGIKDKYLVLKTAPFELEPSKIEDWNVVLKETNRYREVLLNAILAESSPEFILTDGAYAAQEAKRILGANSSLPIIAVDRQAANKSSGILQAGEVIKAQIPGFSDAKISEKMADIPRTHLSYYARIWEGTSGDRVITSSSPKYAGQAFAEVAPKWAYSQKFEMPKAEQDLVQKLIEKELSLGLRKGDETIPAFLARTQAGAN